MLFRQATIGRVIAGSKPTSFSSFISNSSLNILHFSFCYFSPNLRNDLPHIQHPSKPEILWLLTEEYVWSDPDSVGVDCTERNSSSLTYKKESLFFYCFASLVGSFGFSCICIVTTLSRRESVTAHVLEVQLQSSLLPSVLQKTSRLNTTCSLLPTESVLLLTNASAGMIRYV